MSTEKPVELTEAECDSLIVFDTGIYACAAEGYCSGYDHSQPGHDHEDIYDAVARIKAAARREALLEAADWIAEAHPNVRGPLCAAMDIRGFAEVDVVDMADTIARVEALAAGLQEQYEASDYSETTSLGEIAEAIRAALAEPERDEEGGR